MDFLQPPDPPGAVHCLRCGTCVTEDEQRGGVCIDCQPAEDGEQSAFPVAANEYAGHGPSHGITIRDYFAAKAMNGICAHNDTWGLVEQEIADHAYRIADAMLAARVKP
ncbi:hypothetical protein [Pseudomonas sp. Hg5Tf]|uniref:Uncharacterized protein n=1 Tax=Pseudomonas sp. Hg7Tf TaxID=3236988 RepID=A0AB39HVR8_9PSED|nr:hypothetical protein [Pseudomonas sp. Hg5Tf]MDH2559029.1 hypothetical protein [Pseudomonas sp. Hg5Tf]